LIVEGLFNTTRKRNHSPASDSFSLQINASDSAGKTRTVFPAELDRKEKVPFLRCKLSTVVIPWYTVIPEWKFTWADHFDVEEIQYVCILFGYEPCNVQRRIVAGHREGSGYRNMAIITSRKMTLMRVTERVTLQTKATILQPRSSNQNPGADVCRKEFLDLSGVHLQRSSLVWLAISSTINSLLGEKRQPFIYTWKDKTLSLDIVPLLCNCR